MTLFGGVSVSCRYRARTRPGAYHAGRDDSTRAGRGSAFPSSAIGVQEPRDGTVDLVVLALAIVLKHDLSVLVDDILRGPIAIAVGVPCLRIIVLRHRIGDAVPLKRGLNVGGGALERKFRRVDADHDETAVLVFGVEPGDMRQ